MEGTELVFTIPWSALCSDNRKYVTGYVLSREYRESKAFIAALSVAAAKKQHWSCTLERIALAVSIREPDKRRRDINFSKNLKDGITMGGAIWEDDSQVREECWSMCDHLPRSKDTAGATITITLLPPVT
jgi:Holliday junction resolvase RusA-like endonuclease